MTDKQLARITEEADTLNALYTVQHQTRATLTLTVRTGRQLGMHCDSRKTCARALQRLKKKGVVRYSKTHGWIVCNRFSASLSPLL